jgi:cellulose synthase/poly-beta-1,6-N-acetylglucosamine synthase-like glycosyltransferase
VIERHDDAQRGKGFALAFGLDALAQDPPPVVVILDADCRVEPHALDRLAAMAQGSGRPVQAEYLLIPPADPSPIAVVSALAILVRNAVRPLGLHRMGLPCQLTGSGMAFPWSVLRSAAPTRGNIVEDLAMGIDLAMMGHPPLFCPEAAVRSDLPQRDEAATSQRRRWEHGQMATSAGLVPRLLFQGLLARRPDLVALGLDLLVPPLALLVMLVALALGVTTVSGFLSNAWLPAKLLLLATSLITLGVVGSWWKFGRHIVPARHLWSIPHYAAWKVPVYLDFLLKKRQRAWQRTERAPDEEEDSP